MHDSDENVLIQEIGWKIDIYQRSPKRYYSCICEGKPIRLMIVAIVAKLMSENSFDGMIDKWRITFE